MTCTLPLILHPVSQQLLTLYFTGKLDAEMFIRQFSLPNSDYLTLAECLVAVIGGT